MIKIVKIDIVPYYKKTRKLDGTAIKEGYCFKARIIIDKRINSQRVFENLESVAECIIGLKIPVESIELKERFAGERYERKVALEEENGEIILKEKRQLTKQEFSELEEKIIGLQ